MEMAATEEIHEERDRGFPPLLGKDAQKTRAFPTFPQARRRYYFRK